MEQNIIEEELGLFVCPKCWKKIPNYELSERDYTLYITCTCLCNPESLELKLGDYLTQIELRKKIKSECTINPSHKKQAVVYSIKTKHSMCEDCKIVSMILNKDDILINQPLDIQIQCRTHLEKHLSIYCSDCKTFICSKCLKNEHMNHNKESFMEVNEKIKNKKSPNSYLIYKNNNEIKAKELLTRITNQEEVATLNEVSKINNENNSLLFKLIDVLFNTYNTISNHPDETLFKILLHLHYNNNKKIDKYSYLEYVTYLKSYLLISGIKTQFNCICKKQSEGGEILSLIQLSDKTQIAVGVFDNIFIYNIQNAHSPTKITTLLITNLSCMIEAKINNNNYLVVGCYHNITIIDSKEFKSESKMNQTSCVSCLLSLGNNLIASGFENKTIVIFDCSDKDCWRSKVAFGNEPDLIICLFNYDNEHLISTSGNIFNMWNIGENNLPTKKTITVGSTIRALQLLDSTTMIFAEQKGVISAWNLIKNEKINDYNTNNQGDTLCNILLIYKAKYLVAGYEYYKLILKITPNQQMTSISFIPFYIIMNDPVDWCVSLISIQSDYFLSSTYQFFEIIEIPNNILKDNNDDANNNGLVFKID